jgi:hypothetical protein
MSNSASFNYPDGITDADIPEGESYYDYEECRRRYEDEKYDQWVDDCLCGYADDEDCA